MCPSFWAREMPTMPTTAGKGADQSLVLVVATADHAPTTANHRDSDPWWTFARPARRDLKRETLDADD